MVDANESLTAAAAAAGTETEASSYRYWVRNATEDAAPMPLPRKLTDQQPPSGAGAANANLGSVWNSAGTWEEKNLNSWATNRIKELLQSAVALEFLDGRAEISKVSKCVGDAFLVTVRNKKRVGYTYELTLEVRGEWQLGDGRKIIKGHIDIQEFSLGEVDELEIEVSLSDEKDLMLKDVMRIRQDLKMFMKPVREKLLQFEEELKGR